MRAASAELLSADVQEPCYGIVQDLQGGSGFAWHKVLSESPLCAVFCAWLVGLRVCWCSGFSGDAVDMLA